MRRTASCTQASANETYIPECDSRVFPLPFIGFPPTVIHYYYITACVCCEEFAQKQKKTAPHAKRNGLLLSAALLSELPAAARQRALNRICSANSRKPGGVYLGFLTLRGRKFPNGNFRTSVFCQSRTQLVGKTKFCDSYPSIAV